MKISGPATTLLPRLQELAFTPFGLVQLFGKDIADPDCPTAENAIGATSEDQTTHAIAYPFSEEDEDWLRAQLADLTAVTITPG